MFQDCRRIIARDLPEAQRFTRAAPHFILFIEDKDEVIIIYFLHARSDLQRRLAGLTDPAGNSDSQGRPLSRQLPIPANASWLRNISLVSSHGLVWTHASSGANRLSPVRVPERRNANAPFLAFIGVRRARIRGQQCQRKKTMLALRLCRSIPSRSRSSGQRVADQLDLTMVNFRGSI
jgi:hypothetical protein